MPVVDSYGEGGHEVVARMNSVAGATAEDFGSRFFYAYDAMRVVHVMATWQTAGSSTTASLDVVKVTNGQAKASGTSVLAAVIDASTAANTNNVPTLSATAANRVLAAGDTLSVIGAGTLTALDGVYVQVILRKD